MTNYFLSFGGLLRSKDFVRCLIFDFLAYATNQKLVFILECNMELKTYEKQEYHLTFIDPHLAFN